MTKSGKWSEEEDFLIFNNKKDSETWQNFIDREIPLRSYKSLMHRLKRLDILEVRNDWTNDEDDLIRKYYTTLSHKDLKKIIPNRNCASIRSRASRLGIKKGTRYIFTKNDSFFTLPNELNCSVAGTWGSDGCIETNKKGESNRVMLNLATKDFDFLTKIKNALEFTGDIKNYVHKNKLLVTERNTTVYDRKTSYLQISRAKQWIEDLNKHWNITTQKTYSLQPPNITDLNLCMAYICGIVNGDGSILVHNNSKFKMLRITMLGTESLLLWIKSIFEKFLDETLEANVRPERSGARIFSYAISGFRAAKIIEYINALDCVFMDRKWKSEAVLNAIEILREKYPDKFR
jgi:hypothetical protein